jgi:tRNA dimethylallyltransferase
MNIDTPSPAPLAAPLALIAGPTASGKSALALALAERANGVVINADSAQVYADLAVLSARPTAADEARAPHRLYGTRDGAVPCSAADWAEDARHAVFEAHRAGKLPILVGGTGLYVRTLLDGIAPVPEIDPDIRAAVRAMPVSQSFEALRREDPAAAQRLRPSDTTRVARALEVVRSTGTPLADWHQHRSGGIADQVSLHPLILLPPRDWLVRRCDDRFAEMMGEDGLDEVRRLLDRNLNPLLPVMRAIGVRELAALLAGEATPEQALQHGQAATRQYAKRQYTWFSRQPPAGWPRLRDPLDDEAAFAAALETLTPA